MLFFYKEFDVFCVIRLKKKVNYFTRNFFEVLYFVSTFAVKTETFEEGLVAFFLTLSFQSLGIKSIIYIYWPSGLR